MENEKTQTYQCDECEKIVNDGSKPYYSTTRPGVPLDFCSIDCLVRYIADRVI